MFYDSAKDGVDPFDQVHSFQSCSGMTKRRPLTVFYGMMNAAVVNAKILYSKHQPQNTLKRIEYQGFVQRRHSIQSLPHALQLTINNTFLGSMSATPVEIIQLLPTRKRCEISCPSQGKGTRFMSWTCGAPVCIHKFRVFCKDCWEVSVYMQCGFCCINVVVAEKMIVCKRWVSK